MNVEWKTMNWMLLASQRMHVLCKIFKKSGLGPRIGEQYGATFNEQEWDNVINETAMFHLMPCPSSKLGAANEPPVLHTASTSNVVKELHIQNVPSADGLPSELNTSSITAIDEPHCQTRCNGSEMVTANCASDTLDACDPTEFGATEETDEWVRFLSMNNDGGASEKPTGLPAISEAEAQALETNSDYCYHELVRFPESGGVSTGSNLFPAYENTECLNPLLVSRIGTGDNYVEINDIFPLGETASFNLSAPGNLLTQYALEQFPCSELNCPQYDNDGALSASLVAGDFFAPISCTMHDTSVDHIICTTNFVPNDSSNSTMQYPFS